MALRIALLQLVAHGTDIEANLRKGERACRRAAAMDADIALFPEMWSIGYTSCPVEAAKREEWQGRETARDGAFVTHFRRLAQELNMAIALTYLERWPGSPRNSVSVIDRSGNTVMTYAKVHTCDFSMEAACTPGDDFYVCDLDTRSGKVKIGAMICYDREFPESARILMLKGAEIILTPNSCELEDSRIGQFRARAYENMVGVAMANYPAPQCNGHSVAFDAMAFDQDGRPLDPLVVEAGAEEGIFLADFDLDRLRTYRDSETWGNAYRKPATYGLLNSTDVEPPFARFDARR
ncbi:MAG: carbon-nitrogen hydrolase family protein [Actinomycetota bacterium]|nr:carbon-nitrogen hydrolase family protein [Actinomycetota bacterium]